MPVIICARVWAIVCMYGIHAPVFFLSSGYPYASDLGGGFTEVTRKGVGFARYTYCTVVPYTIP